MDSAEPVGSMIRRTRNRLGYSQYEIAIELAKISGNDSLTREEVSRWERGKRIPGPYWRQWISRVLLVPPQDLDLAARIARGVRVSGARREHAPLRKGREEAGAPLSG